MTDPAKKEYQKWLSSPYVSEEMKKERRQNSREQRDAEAQRRFDMKQMKKKEKRRGH